MLKKILLAAVIMIVPAAVFATDTITPTVTETVTETATQTVTETATETVTETATHTVTFTITPSPGEFVPTRPVEFNGKLRVDGLQLTSECGNPVQLRGVSSHGLQWYDSCLTSDSLDFIAYDMNADVFRIALYVESGGYKSNPSGFTARVNELVDWCEDRGIYALIDWHILEDGDPNENIEYARTFWEDMAREHAGKRHVLYEICNEPNGVDWDAIKTYADDIIPIIRTYDTETVIIVGTPNWSQLGWDVVNDPLSYSNIMYAFHFYAGTHSTDMLSPFVSELPIFCTEWGTSAASGDGNDDYDNADAFLDIMNGNNTEGVTISWASWSFSDDYRSSSELVEGTCPDGPWNDTSLTTAGQYVKTNINDPAKDFIDCGTPTITPTEIYLGTPTITPTSTITPTPLPTDIFYDGDTAGAALSDGTTGGGASITETSEGAPGNAMRIEFIDPDWWQEASWQRDAVQVEDNTHIQFDIRSAAGTVSSLFLIMDWNLWNSEPDDTPEKDAIREALDIGIMVGGITSSWKTARVRLDDVFLTVPPSINIYRLIANTNQNYTVLIDNISLVMVPTPTITPTVTVTPTATITPTWSFDQFPEQINVTEHVTYPNPSDGSKIKVRFKTEGKIEELNLYIYTYGDRLIGKSQMTELVPDVHEIEWIPSGTLGNGIYYYVLEAKNDYMTNRKIGAAVVIK